MNKIKIFRQSKVILIGALLFLIYISWYCYERPHFIKVDACTKWNLDTNKSRTTCNKVLHMQISREFAPIVDERGALDIFWINLSRVKIFDDAVMWKNDDDMNIDIHFFDESKEQWFAHAYEMHAVLANPIIVDIPEGDGLLVKSEDTHRYSSTGAGFSYIIPKDGGKDVWISCAMPYYIGGAELKTDVGCNVNYFMQQGFYISYQMRRKHLYRWREVNQKVIKQVEQAIFNQTKNSGER
ncbi:hypothetical protein INP77_10320 [Methylophilus sp. 13]|uniref:hypothetical protein n=1 Tax=Methylophilus sp. 13 TaxID=2781018 RepID=UPI0018902FEC|nr:hypothetical protein [Methylophilus sp. 13]MBF5039884.1 hypothetical protein [Methylophilus sp. 13]